MIFIRALSILIAAVGPLVAAQPTAPTNLTASVTNNCSAVFLSWSAVSANPQVQGYKIYRTNLLDGTGVVTTLTNRLTTNWTDTAVSPVSYRYQVTAYNNTESPRSSAVTVNPCPDNTAPTVPASVVANSIGCTAASLSWSASADNTGPAYQVKSGFAKYRVYRDGDLISEVQTNAFSDDGLDEGSAYAYRISAVDSNANESAQSPVLWVTTTSAVPAYVEKIAVTNDVAVLTWRGTPGVKYQVLSAPGFRSPWSLVDAPTTNTTITALAVEPTASYRVARAAQLSPYKDNATNFRKDKSPPTTPTNLTVTVLSCSNVLLSWSPSGDTGTRVGSTVYTSGLAAYLIYRTNGAGGFLKRVDAPTNSTTDSTVAPSTRYTYAVVALDNAGNQSASSIPATVTTPPCANPPPCTYAIAPSGWTAPAGGGNTPVSVTASSGCSWTVSNPCSSWVTVSPTSGSGNGSVTVSVTANITGVQRSCTLTIAGQSFTITQPAVCTATIAVVVSPAGGGTVSGGGTVDCGASVTVTATPSACYHFVGWTENGTVVSAAGSYTFTANENRALVANFALNTYTITASVSPAGGGTVSGGGTVNCGDSVTVTATPNPGYNFANWMENGTVVSTAASYSFFVGGDRHLVAHFTAVPPPATWPKAFPGSSYNYGRSLLVDRSGDVILAALFAGTADFGNGLLTSAGAADMILARYSATGQCRWVRQYGSTGTEAPKSMVLDAQGNLIIAGSFSGAADVGGGQMISAGQDDIFVAKYSPDGHLLWVKQFGGAFSDVANGVAVDQEGNIVLVGTFKGSLNFGGPLLFSMAMGMDTYVAKLAGTDGSHLWSKNFPNMADDQGQGVALDANGNVFLTGTFGGGIDFGGGMLPAVHGYDAYVAKLSPQGTHVWSRAFGGTGGDSGKSVAVDSQGNVLVTGWFTKSVDFGAGSANLLTNLTSFYDILLAKLQGGDGTCAWAKSLSGPSYDDPVAVATDANGNVYVTGYFPHELNAGGTRLVATGNQDVFVTKYSATGDLLLARSYGGLIKGYDGDYAVPSGILVRPDGQMFACGSFKGTLVIDGTTLISRTNYAAWMHRFSLP